MSARVKLLAPFLVLLAAVLGGMHFILFDVLKHRLISDKLQSERQALSMIALAAAPDLLGGDLAKIHDTLTDVWSQRKWWFSLSVRNAEGALIFPLSEPTIPEGLDVLSTPIIAGNRNLGVLTVAADLPATIQGSLDILLKLEILVAVLVLGGGAMVVHLQMRWLLKPLAGLARAALAVSQGRSDAPLPRASGEMGQVVESFARMTAAVADREADLRRSESRLAAVLDNSGEAVVTFSADATILSCNKAAGNIFRSTSEDLIGSPFSRLIPEHDFVPTAEEGCETLGSTADGVPIALWLILTEVTTEQDSLYVATISDITERKQQELELRESESRFRDLAGSASDWFWESDADNQLTFLSERIGAVLGVKPSGLLGFSYMDLGLADAEPGLLQAHLEDLSACRPFRDVVFPVGPLGGKDGRFIRISGLPMFGPQGEFQGWRGVGADITREVMAERRAEQARRQLADAIESISDGIAVYDPQDRLVLCNAEYRRLFEKLGEMLQIGVEFQDLISCPQASQLFDPEGLEWSEWVRRRLARHAQADGEAMLQHLRDGRWLLSREHRTADGGVVAVRTDITLLKQRELALDRLQRRYQLILDAAGDGIVGLDACGAVSFANRAAADLLGWDVDSLAHRSFHDVIEPDGAPDGPVRRAHTLGLAEKVDNALFTHRDGRAVQVEYLVAPILEQDLVAGAVVVFRDVALRRLYEQTLADQQAVLERQVAERTAELSASQQRLKAITDTLFEGVLMVDPKGVITFANESARNLLQAPDAQGRELDQVMRLNGTDGPTDFAHSCWPQVMKQGRQERCDDAEFIAEGKNHAVAYACSPLLEQGECAGAVISFRDISQLKTAQQEALQSSRLAGVGQLAAGIAHEINTPIQYVGDNLRFVRDAVADMSAVLETARKLAETGGSPLCGEFQAAYRERDVDYLKDEAPAAIDQSLSGVAQVARIVLSMKEFSHPGTTHKSMTDINRALDGTITVSRNTWKQTAELDTDFDPDLPPVYCHAGELNQVFLNLIVNAAHAVEESGKPGLGRITVTTRRDGDNVKISVRDTGKGIPPEIQQKIFDPFFTTKSVGKGTGQGLAICLDVVKVKHGGRLEVHGNPGEGAEFVATLPIGATAQAGDHD